MSNYKTLNAWKVSMQLVKEVYLITKKFPREELYGLISQSKRTAVSIPSNIAEGIGWQYKKDTLQFLYISRGSVYETETLLNIAVMVDIMDEKTFTAITPLVDKALQVMNGLIKYYENSNLR